MLMHCWWGFKMLQLLWKTVWNFLKKLKTELPCYLATPILGIQKTLKSGSATDICTPMFIATAFTIAKRWKQPKCPLTDEQIKYSIYIQWNIIQT